ncbi:hypothetical protein WRSd3_p00112 (plasmid) [Shigella dysenteriae WRSd3]|uniref:Uncharacterized protein n=1 Tax=Shigella dysenteriae WRSd3 TaxID=1401327 RepID=A0A090N946_SHIDY|nr:hypothetical protein WRSd3_p00112 [Shigella dysenteriae WRSd3]
MQRTAYCPVNVLGLSGSFSYIFGSIVATLGMGLVVDYLGCGATFIVLILSLFLPSFSH